VNQFSSWVDYYLLTGAMAGQLIGLVFVALSVGTRLETTDVADQRTWIVPIFVQFGAVVVVAMLFVAPGLSDVVMSLGLCLVSAFALIYAVLVGLQMRRQHATRAPIGAADWLFGLWIPIVGYASLFEGGNMVFGGQGAAYDVVALAVAVLLLVGIRNAWTLAMWMLLNRRGV